MAHSFSNRRFSFQPALSLILAIAMIALLWLSGGASRPDALGQVVVRAGAWAILMSAVLLGPRPAFDDTRPVLLLLFVAVLLPLVQLIPLPPSWWQKLPSREILLIPGEPLPWRPWTMTPGATRNALASLIVPVSMVLVLMQAGDRTRRAMPTILLGMIGTAMLLGLLQFSGAQVNNPFLNDTPGDVSGIFANRNHFALLLAIGCVIAPVWAFIDPAALRWRGPLATGLVLLFVLTILATGSRTGMLLGGLALGMALLLIGQRLRYWLRNGSRWLLPAFVAAVVLTIMGFIALSFAADRADAINRLIALEGGEDMRSRALPTVLSMVREYFPFGTGFGSFDPIFRIHEPFALLKLSYFNQAHNDYLGIALDGGIAGIAALAAGILWWLVATIRIWRSSGDDTLLLGKLGSAIILLVLIASVTDYPARTPTIMAFLTIAGIWLARANFRCTQAALPLRPPNL